MRHHPHGPWRVIQNWNGKIAIADSRHHRVGGVPHGKDGRGLCVAQLIAAAPELLEALKALAAYEDDPEYGEPGFFHAGDITAARAAIRKAEGDA